MFELNFSLQGGDVMRNFLDMTISKVSNLTQPMKEALDYIEEHTKENFSKSGSETGGKRPSLATSTQKARSNRRGYYKNAPSNPGILRWTGRLLNDVSKYPSEKQGKIVRNAPYAGFHNIGGSKIPQRKFAELDSKTNAEIARIFQTFFHYN